MSDFCVYVTYHPLYGYYYVGKSSVFAVSEQHYRGSGYLITDELESERGAEYKIEILATFQDEQAAYDAERDILGDRWKTDPKCLNKRPGGGAGMTPEERYKRASKPFASVVKQERRIAERRARGLLPAFGAARHV